MLREQLTLTTYTGHKPINWYTIICIIIYYNVIFDNLIIPPGK